MKNLDLWNLSVRKLKLKSEEKFAICRGHDEDSSTSALYMCTYNLVVRNHEENGEIKWSKNLSKLSTPGNRPVNITYLSLQNIICVGLEDGELFTISDAGNVCELVGAFQSGLLAMEFSPDQELLALVTKELDMVLLSLTFDPINEVNLLDQEFGNKEFITVGWGKKETQFHGSEGKQAAKAKNEVSPDLNILSDNKIKITWRGDGHLFAVGFTMDGIRRFKVFDREGHLQYSSEKQQGLEANLAWRPSGNVIATTQKLSDKYLVSFFEKNGLKHGEFKINVNSTTQVEDIIWSADSEILSLQCKDTATDTQKLLLYTTGNYHWYLKQTLTFDSDHKISKVLWDADFDVSHNKTLHIILQNGQHYSYTWVWNVDHSKGNSINDDAVVTVIDGMKLLITGFRQTVVPPPMCALEIKLEANVNSIHFAPQTDKNVDPNTFLVFTEDNKLVFYVQTQKFPLQYKEQKTIQFDKYQFPFQYYNWYWINSSTLVCIMMYSDSSYYLMEYSIEGESLVQKNTCLISVHKTVTRIQSHPNDSNKIFLQLSNGEVMQYALGGEKESQVSFKVACPKFNVVAIGENLHFMGLSHKGHLYIDDGNTINSVNSFFVHTHFLLITTLHHELLCTELTESGINAIKEYQKIESDHVYKRKVERGSKLVITVPCDTRTVFQMPRGNLEAIQPRPLSLKIIGEYLDALKYREAFDLMRKQRINLNLIYDHEPEKLIKNIDVFLDSVNNNSWLNLFLSELENTDVTKSMYCSSYAGKPDKVKQESKIEKICNIVREHLSMRPDSDGKILPLITTFVKKNTEEELEKALTIIKDLKLQELGGSKLPVGSDEALKYLLYMVDVNQLFDVALGMYDFDLVLFIANKSQKDPKEFIPMLNELNEMDENYKRFSINKHLKRFNRAVDSLVKCGPSRHNELRTFVKYHSLYKDALSKFSSDDEIFKQISDDYGSYLKLTKHFTLAGIIYERSNNIDKAVESYKDALEWELALKLAQPWPKDQFRELCWELINALKEEKRHSEALIILEQFYGDSDETISYATECGRYKTALRLSVQYQKHQFKDEKLLPTLLADYENIKELIETNWSTFIKHKDRLQVVRVHKKQNPVEHYDSYAMRDCDLYSDAGSTVASSSRGSTRSYRSSKNRRKHERKVASLKEGSQYEDVALVMALHTLVTSSFELRPQVKEVVIALSSFGKDKEALILQTSLDKLLKNMKDSFKDIWTNELVIEATNANIAAQNVAEGTSVILQGIASLAPHIRVAPVIQEMNWMLEGLD